MKLRNTPNIIDLFSGVGGLSLGAARAGFAICGAVDNDSNASTAHKLNFPSTVHTNSDISNLTGKQLKHELQLNDERITGVVGGPPCQGFSNMGRRDKHDIRNTLFVEFFRLVCELQPKFFMVENVPGIMHSTFGSIREHAFSLICPEYIVLPPLHLSANDYGAATSRTRVFFIGYRPSEMACLMVEQFNSPKGIKPVHVKNALYGLPKRINPKWQSEKDSWQIVGKYVDDEFGRRLQAYVPPGVGNLLSLKRLRKKQEVSGFLGTVHSDAVAVRYSNTEQGQYDSISKAFRLDLNSFCPTIRAGTGPDRGSFQAVRPIHPTESRVITPREGARLQGFPDWFQFSPTKWHSFRQIGNSVSPILAEYVFSVIAGALD